MARAGDKFDDYFVVKIVLNGSTNLTNWVDWLEMSLYWYFSRIMSWSSLIFDCFTFLFCFILVDLHFYQVALAVLNLND